MEKLMADQLAEPRPIGKKKVKGLVTPCCTVPVLMCIPSKPQADEGRGGGGGGGVAEETAKSLL